MFESKPPGFDSGLDEGVNPPYIHPELSQVGGQAVKQLPEAVSFQTLFIKAFAILKRTPNRPNPCKICGYYIHFEAALSVSLFRLDEGYKFY